MIVPNVFIKSRMNKDIDERLLPEGEYPHAENVRVIDSGDSHMGAVENDLPNVALTDYSIPDMTTIGCYADASNQKIYFFNTSPTKDMIIEWDDINQTANVVLESSVPGVLNFNKNYLITGINKINNEDYRKDLLAWTDDYNPPRMINIERAKTYGLDNFIEDDISVIKKPPMEAPQLLPTYSTNLAQNNLDNKFLAFGTRNKYVDGQVSAISPYTNYYFTPSPFSVDYNVLENTGMVNKFNSVKIKFSTGDERVKEIELIVKASNSNTLYVVETFNKETLGWADNTTQEYTFSNSKLYTSLPQDELGHSYDNVPRLAKAQDVVGNRLIYGNYLENYNLKDRFGRDINIDFTPTLYSQDLTGTDLPVEINNNVISFDPFIPTVIDDGLLSFDLSGISLKRGTLLTFNLYITERTYDDGRFISSIPYILEDDYPDTTSLAASSSFISFVNDTMTNVFMSGYVVNDPPADSVIEDQVGFTINSVIGDVITITAPRFSYLISDTPPAIVSYWGFSVDEGDNSVNVREDSTSASLKSNRSYETSIIYMDAEGRRSTALTSINNTVHIPHSNAINQNKMRITINNPAPYWAKRYTFAVKQNKEKYNEIYANVFYVDGQFRWVKLEGTNKDKVNENDTLVIKTDLSGFVPTLTTVRVLEVADKTSDFLDGNNDDAGTPITEQPGKYMKFRVPTGIDINYRPNSFIHRGGHTSSRGDNFYMYVGELSEYNTTTSSWEDIPITQGSRISLYIMNKKYGSSGGYIDYNKSFIAGADYDNMEDWFNAELGSIPNFTGEGFVRGSYAPTGLFGQYVFTPDPAGALYFRVHNYFNGNGQHPSYMDGDIQINKNTGLLIFETDPKDTPDEIFYECSETFEIDEDGNHLGNISNQSGSFPAVCEIDYYNCFAFGNGAESNAYRSGFNTNWVNLDLRPSLVTTNKYQENRRFADLTYGGIYNEGTGLNDLCTFNLITANFKDDIEKKYGSIQKIYSRDTDLLVFQEDKVGYVLYGKSVFNNADGSGGAVGLTKDVLGQYIPCIGEYGISKNPESFAINADTVYFTDTKRGVPLILKGKSEIVENNYGTKNHFKDTFRTKYYSKRVGGYDPFMDQYNLYADGENINPEIEMTCSQLIERGNFSGTVKVTMNYDIFIGDAGFSYITNGVPLRFILNWNGNKYDTGFVGDSSYDDQLIELGYSATTGSGTGSIDFIKDQTLPTTATITIMTPFENAQFKITGLCPFTNKTKVISVVASSDNNLGKTLDTRYKWVSNDYISSFKHYDNPFGETLLSLTSGVTGTGGLPIDESTVIMETYKGFTHDGIISETDKFYYLLSNTLYTESDLDTMIGLATEVTKYTSSLDTGDTIVQGSFTLDRGSYIYLYLIWDYRTE